MGADILAFAYGGRDALKDGQWSYDRLYENSKVLPVCAAARAEKELVHLGEPRVKLA